MRVTREQPLSRDLRPLPAGYTLTRRPSGMWRVRRGEFVAASSTLQGALDLIGRHYVITDPYVSEHIDSPILPHSLATSAPSHVILEDADGGPAPFDTWAEAAWAVHQNPARFMPALADAGVTSFRRG